MRRFIPLSIASCLATVVATGFQWCDAQQTVSPGTEFIRVQRDLDGEPTKMQTSVVRFKGGAGLTVDLVGAVHIGDADYYQKLNRQFKNYDVVLYELVAPKGARPGVDQRGENPVSMMQGLSKNMMNLESQLEHIDYTADNFVHADMSPEEIRRSMESRGDNTLSVALDVMADLIRQSNKQTQQMQASGASAPETDLLSMLFAPDRDIKMKKMMAEQFAAMGALDSGMGPTLNRMLVADRNAAAMRVFQQELVKGRKKIAIFYGAAHMPDFASRLQDDFGLKPASETWVTAWDLTADITIQGGQQTDPLMELLKMFSE